MKRNAMPTAIAGALGMLLLILDSRTALQGAREGIDLCIRTVIPSLFPFFVLSILLTGSLLGRSIPMLRPLGSLTGIPAGSESILLTGLLGGYPVGAQNIAGADLSKEDAARMLAFCNNAGPSFIFGMAAAMFPYHWMAWALWGIHILSALIVGWILPGKSRQIISLSDRSATSISSALTASIRVMAGVCGWVVLFRVILAILDRWIFWAIPENLQVILTGLLELTNGCCALNVIDNLGLRFVICAGMLAFGGLCVAMQTASVAANVDRRLYFPGKLLQTLISVLLALIVQSILPYGERMPVNVTFPAAVLLILLLLPGKKQISSSIPGKVRV